MKRAGTVLESSNASGAVPGSDRMDVDTRVPDAPEMGHAFAGAGGANLAEADAVADVGTSSSRDDLGNILKNIADLDKDGIFQAPVSLDLYPDYSKFVLTPMDFGTMIRRHRMKPYLSVHEVSSCAVEYWGVSLCSFHTFTRALTIIIFSPAGSRLSPRLRQCSRLQQLHKARP